MSIEEHILEEARKLQSRLVGLQQDAEQTKLDYDTTIRRLHAAGGSMREIGAHLGLSHGRVHQIVNDDLASARKGAGRAVMRHVAAHTRKLGLKMRAQQVVAITQGVAADHVEPRESTDTAEISVILPVFNEEDTVASSYRGLVLALDRLARPYEIVIVDDGSLDATWELVRKLSQEDARVRGVRLARNFGQHTALRTGFAQARGHIVVTVDADLRKNLGELPQLVAVAERP